MICCNRSWTRSPGRSINGRPMLQLRRLDTGSPDFEAELSRLLDFENTQDQRVEDAVSAILADVKRRGDVAVLEYTRRFDRIQASDMAQLRIAKTELEHAF